MIVFVLARGGVAIAESELRLLQWRERVFEQGALLHLAHLLGKISILCVRVLGRLHKEFYAARVWADDAERSVGRAIIFV